MESEAQFHAVLIDDDPAYNFINKILFEEMIDFHSPLFFSDPEQALVFMEEQGIKTNHHPFPQLTKVDINMPGLDGYDFVEKLRVLCPQLHQRTLLCFLSSSAHPKDQQRIKDLGVECYVEKTLEAKHLQSLGAQLRKRFQRLNSR